VGSDDCVDSLGLALLTKEGQPAAGQTVNGTKFEILFPALFPLVGPGAITPTKKVPGVFKNEAGILACTWVGLRTLEAKFTLVLLELFQVTAEPGTNPEPFTVRGISGWPTTAPLGVIDVMVEVTVGEAPR